MSKGPTLPISKELHQMKYRTEGESYDDAMNRIATALSDSPEHRSKFHDVISDMRFLPAGRVQASVGAARQVTPYNCFVSGTIEDTFINGNGSIMARATEAAETMRKGGGIGYDFSTLRPRGDLIKSLQSLSSGPISFMGIFDAICRTVSSAGHRRGAQMAVLRVDHPDILEYITAKHSQDRLGAFNTSIAVTDAFMEALEAGKSYDLTFNGKVYDRLDAKEVWDKIMLSTWDWAEPGVLFIDTINDMNNLWYTEKIAATNPCGEQPLPPYGACLLGSFNLVKYLNKRSFDKDQLRRDIEVVVRAMDNVIDRAIYPLPEQAREAQSKRRMGLGVTGLANALEYLGAPYGSPKFLELENDILKTVARESYLASIKLAREKGSFAFFDKDYYCQSNFVKTLDEDVQEMIKKYGIRNSHLTSIAPTGTISLCADNVSSGIEPVFSYSYDRTLITFDGPQVETVEDYGVRELKVRGRRAGEISVKDHLGVLLTAQANVDSAVSKTVNVGSNVTYEDFKQLYKDAWVGGAKGCTTFRADGKKMGILVTKDAEEFSEDLSCSIDPLTGARSCE